MIVMSFIEQVLSNPAILGFISATIIQVHRNAGLFFLPAESRGDGETRAAIFLGTLSVGLVGGLLGAMSPELLFLPQLEGLILAPPIIFGLFTEKILEKIEGLFEAE